MLELGSAFNIKQQFDMSQYQAMDMALLNYKLQNPKASMTDIMIRMQEILSVSHYGITPRELIFGFKKSPQKPGYGIQLQEVGYEMKFKEDLKPIFKEGNEFKLEQTSGGDTPPLIQNPLTNPTYGGSTGIIPPVWLDIMIRKTSRYTMAKNLAMVFMMKNLVDVAPIKWTKVDDSVDNATFYPIAEGRAGIDYNNTYKVHRLDCYKYLFHSGLTWEVIVALDGKIDVQADVIDDLALAHALLLDRDFWEGQYAAIVSGTYRRWETNAWANSVEIPLGTASVKTTYAKKHRLFYDLTTGKTYYPAVGAGDENKYQSSTPREEYLSPSGSVIFDVFVDLAELMKAKNRRLEWIAVTPGIATMLAKDSRFQNTLYKTGTIRFQDEGGYLGRVAIGGTNNSVDLWEIPNNAIAAKTTDDAVAITHLVFGGEYRKTGVIGQFAPFGLFVDEGFEVKAVGVGGSSVLRRNDTKVLTTKSVQAVAPWDTEALVLCQIVNTAHN
jgi:hypothetical protein